MNHGGTELQLPDSTATEALGAQLAAWLPALAVVWLQGDLGAGKTTLVRGLLRALGHTGPVKSPTYTLVEPYQLGDHRILHCDLYRLTDPEELEFLGLRDELDRAADREHSWWLVEWPERGRGWLPPATLTVELIAQGNGRLGRLRVDADMPNAAEFTVQLQKLFSNNSSD